ncbi:RHS repeat-associated core domain-containing protein [Planctomycetota bacterium]
MLRKFVYGPGIDEPICMIDVTDSNAVYYYHFDGLGSVAALSDASADIVESYSYDVFGAPTIYDENQTEISQSAVGNPYMFTGRRADDETALYYYRARYYAFDIGRFLQTDPIQDYVGTIKPQ